MSTERDEALAKAGVREIEVSIILTVPAALPQRNEDRLVAALSTYAADMSYVKEAGIRKATLPYDDLLFLRNEVNLMADELAGLDTGEVFEKMTCSEAQSIADVLTAAGRGEVGDFIITEHARGDNDAEDTHHNQYQACLDDECEVAHDD